MDATLPAQRDSTHVSLAGRWWMAARPATLAAAFVPVAVGSACAHQVGGFRAGPALAALFGAVMIQIGTNFANDVFDHEKGADTEARLGPTRVVQAGLLTPTQVRRAMVLCFALASAAGIYLTWVAGWPIIAIGIASVLSGIAYTGGPYPLGYHGLGDVFVMLFFGFVAVCGTAFVQVGYVPAVAWLAAIAVGSLATSILVVNNVRDRDTDAVAGKRTLAVRFGRRAGHAEYIGMMVMAYAVPIALAHPTLAGPAALLPLLTLPWAVWLTRQLITLRGRALNTILAATAKLMLVHGVLCAIGLLLS